MSSEHGEKLKPQEDGVIFVILQNGGVILERRLKPNSGYYGYTIIPGGKVEDFDEDGECAVVREALEEKGIVVLHSVHLDSFLDMSLSGNFRRMHAYLIDEFEGEIVNKEPEKCENIWVPVEQADNCLELASSKYVIGLVKEKLGK